MSQLDKVRRVYDADPAAYHRGMSFLTERLLAGRRNKVGESVKGRLLDVGFGTGLSLPHYPSSVEVIGIDASLGMLRYARTEVDRLGKPAEVLQMDAEHLAFADRTFDSVAFNLCLCTIPNPERAIREAIRVARPGAPMIFLEHVRSHVLPVAVLQEVMNPVLVALQGDHFNRRTAEIVERSGVKVVSIDRWALGFFNLIAGQAP
ncbi:MAG: class I SAM-dependent methyltransferase [Candidatus Dormiibacterota bacterium]